MNFYLFLVDTSGKNTKNQLEHVKPKFEKFITKNFNRIQFDNPDQLDCG